MKENFKYPDNYILDEETEIAKFGFLVNVSGQEMFKGDNCKIRCYRNLRRHFVSKGFKIYAVNCTDDNLNVMIGNCTFCDIQHALRLFNASYFIFLDKTYISKTQHYTSIRFIKSYTDFKRSFYKVTVSSRADFADCITSNWNSFRYYLTGKWDYNDIISQDEVYEAFGGSCDPYIFAKSVFNSRNLEFNKTFEYLEMFFIPYKSDSDSEEVHIEYIINKSLSNFYSLPIDFFYLFPKMRKIITIQALKNNKLSGYLIFNLINQGISFRKSAEKLGCSYSKLYSLYYTYLEEIKKKEEGKGDTCEKKDPC